MGLHVCQIMGYEQLNQSLDLISHHSAKTLNIEEDYGIEVGKSANLIILPAENDFDALRRQVPVQYSIRAGEIIAKTELPKTSIYLAETETVNFKR